VPVPTTPVPVATTPVPPATTPTPGTLPPTGQAGGSDGGLTLGLLALGLLLVMAGLAARRWRA
jgi:hypothetical protein